MEIFHNNEHNEGGIFPYNTVTTQKILGNNNKMQRMEPKESDQFHPSQHMKYLNG
jgi:hypothetical protein